MLQPSLVRWLDLSHIGRQLGKDRFELLEKQTGDRLRPFAIEVGRVAFFEIVSHARLAADLSGAFLTLILSVIALLPGYWIASEDRAERNTDPLVMVMRNRGFALPLVQPMASRCE